MVLTARSVRRGLHAWRSSLQLRIGAITMVVAGTMVVIVSLVLFGQIRDQLLSVQRQAAMDQAQAGVCYAQGQVRDRHRRRSQRAIHAGPHGAELHHRGGAAGDFDVVMVYITGDIERRPPAGATSTPRSPPTCAPRSPRAAQAYRYALVPDATGDPVPTLLVGAPVPTERQSGDQIELYFAFPLDQEQQSL